MIFKLAPQLGHPLAALSSRHRLSRGEEFVFSPRLIQLVNTRSSESRAPVFVGSVSCIGTHQAPIRIKALGRSLRRRVSSRPWQLSCPRKLSVPRRVQGYGSQILWLIPCGRPTLMWLTAWACPLIKSSPSCLSLRDATAANQCCVVVNQPQLRAHCPVPTVSVLCQANALVTSNATWSFIM